MNTITGEIYLKEGTNIITGVYGLPERSEQDYWRVLYHRRKRTKSLERLVCFKEVNTNNGDSGLPEGS